MVMGRTHKTVNVSLAVITLGLVLRANLAIIIGGAITVLIVDALIDLAGHRTSDDGHSMRTPLTHSVLTGPLWGAVVGFFVGCMVQIILAAPELLLFTILGTGAAFVHLLLDAGTFSGIYIPNGYRWAYAHYTDLTFDNFLICATYVIDILLLPEILRQYIPVLPFAFGIFGALGILFFGSITLMMIYRMYRMKVSDSKRSFRVKRPSFVDPRVYPRPAKVLHSDIVTVPGHFKPDLPPEEEARRFLLDAGITLKPKTGKTEKFQATQTPTSRPAFCYRCGNRILPLQNYCFECGTPRDTTLPK